VKRALRRLFTILVPVIALACAEVPGVIGPANDALGVLCETRAALVPAHEALEKGDVSAAIDLLKAYLNEHGHDEEVAALLQLLEAQVHKLIRRDPYGDRIVAPPPGWGRKVI